MDFITLMFIAIGLAMDCFAVCLGVGTSMVQRTARAMFRLPLHFGIFQGLMTLLGWLVGNTFIQLIAGFDHWVAFVLLAVVAVRMIRSGLETRVEEVRTDPTRGATMVMLSVATSLDALAVGLSLALLHTSIVSASLVIGLVSLVISLVGILVGNLLGQRFGKRMEILGGVILLVIGLRILYTHLVS